MRVSRCTNQFRPQTSYHQSYAPLAWRPALRRPLALPCKAAPETEEQPSTAEPGSERIKQTLSGLDSLIGSSPTATTTTSLTSASNGTHTSTSTANSSTDASDKQDTAIKKTMAGLDALLGIQDDDKPARGGKLGADFKAQVAKKRESASSDAADGPSISVSEDVLKKLADAEAQRLANNDPDKAPVVKGELEEQFQKIIDKARRLAEEQAKQDATSTNKVSEAEQAQLRREFENLLKTVSKSPDMLDKDDIKRLKDAAFGPMTFWVTETLPIQEAERTGLLIRGNLRDDREKVFQHVCTKVKELFQDKYEVLLVEDLEEDGLSSTPPPAPSSSGRNAGAPVVEKGPRVAFQIVPAAQAQPPQTNGWQRASAFVLSLFFIGTCIQLALAANIAKLPKETLDWFSNPANIDSDQLPPGLDTWDPTSYVQTAVPVFYGILLVNVMHEIGHRIAAGVKGVKLGPTYFIPNFQIGTFGGITPINSLLKDKKQLWDIAAGGPLAGFLVSAALLVLGLSASDPDVVPKDMLVPVPSPLFQGSLMLGTITRLVLGEDTLRGSEVLVSPLAIAGWCGMVTTALNLLPVGSLDGGRMMQGAFGKSALSLSSFFTYVGLGLGLLGSSLALPFGLYVIICQRTAEKYIKDSVGPAGSTRQTATAVAVLAAILVLLPMAPELADAWGVGPTDPFL